MSMLVELFGEDVLRASLSDIKDWIKALPSTQRERRSYLLKEYARLKNIKLSSDDFADVRA